MVVFSSSFSSLIITGCAAEFPGILDGLAKVLLFVRSECRVPIGVRKIDTSKSSGQDDHLLSQTLRSLLGSKTC